jgi:hypothetical protein
MNYHKMDNDTTSHYIRKKSLEKYFVLTTCEYIIYKVVKMKCKRCNNKAVSARTLCIECARRQKEIADKCRQKKKLLGICTQCSNKASDGHTVCDSCLKKSHDKILSKKELGLCLDCNKKCGSIYCKNCSAIRGDIKASKRSEKLKSGTCMNCNNTAEIGFKKCAECLKSSREQRQSLIQNNICVACTVNYAADGLKRCVSCNAYDIERRASFKANNKCLCCGRDRGFGKYCDECYLKLRAKVHLGSRKYWKQLKELFDKQNGKCPYTGEDLTIGGNAELDHIVSKSNGGKNILSNFQWTLRVINRMKSSCNDDEFLKIIKQIYEHKKL